MRRNVGHLLALRCIRVPYQSSIITCASIPVFLLVLLIHVFWIFRIPLNLSAWTHAFPCIKGQGCDSEFIVCFLFEQKHFQSFFFRITSVFLTNDFLRMTFFSSKKKPSTDKIDGIATVRNRTISGRCFLPTLFALFFGCRCACSWMTNET